MDDETNVPVEPISFYAVVDLFGHNRKIGKLSTVNTGVELLYRIEIPTKDGGFVTEFFGKGAIYSIQPMTEEACRIIAERTAPPSPINYFDLPTDWREAIAGLKRKALAEGATAQTTQREMTEADEAMGGHDPDPYRSVLCLDDLHAECQDEECMCRCHEEEDEQGN